MRILVVEDETLLSVYLVRALKEEGYNAEYIANGTDALAFIEEFHNEIDAIVLDIMLPGLSGLAICRFLRKKHITTPILILTAKDQEQEKIEGLDAGADDYLTKPFSLNELMARLRSLFRRTKGDAAEILQNKDIVMDTKSMKVTREGQDVRLTLKEYALLKLLLSHPNQVLNREQILEQVWDMNYTTFSNVVDVHITYLRKKLHDTNTTNIIESIRGVGYRFNA